MTSHPRSDKPVLYSPDLYEKYTGTYVAAYDDLMIRRVGDELNAHERAIVVDVGTGTAQLLFKLADALPAPSIHFIGTDYFDDMVAQAESAVQASPHRDRITIVKDDVHRMCFPDNFCDLVISRSTIHHWRAPVSAFQEICRILRPGGVGLIHDIRRDAPDAVRAAFQLPRRAAGVPPSNFEEKYTPREIDVLLRSSGIPARWSIHAPNEGVAALGFELRLQKNA